MANKLSKALANNENNPFLDIARNTEEKIQANANARAEEKSKKDAEPVKAEKTKKADQEKKAPGKGGRPKKAQTVKDTAHRIAFNINNDLFDYWKAEAEADRTTMAAIINQLLKAEKERRESGRE